MKSLMRLPSLILVGASLLATLPVTAQINDGKPDPDIVVPAALDLPYALGFALDNNFTIRQAKERIRQQEGVVLNVTEAMRGYLRWQGLPLRDETRTIMIPARPFIDPGMEAIRGRATYLFTRAFVRGFKTRWFG